MERKSHWPWKRKSSKNSGAIVAVSATASPANQSSRQHEDHGLSKLLADQVQEANQRWQEGEDKIRALTAKLAAAQAELTEKENHVKQHAKVAEEAVTGWEKAESETASIKLQLDASSRKNSDLESKISQLDAALKESARNLQKAKEEHEWRMQDLAARKNKECDKIRQELEARLSDVGHRLLESTAESKVLAATLGDRMRTIAELSEARSSAEAEIGVLNVRLEEAGKDNLSLQYEIQVLNKQLQIRDEEKDFCKRESDAAQRIQQEGVKKIQQLEGEIQRLRTLVRRKLPGPAAMAQMKNEVDSWGRDDRRRSFGGSNVKNVGDNRMSKDFQIQLLTERVLCMEEETKLLREVLAQKNNELQAARVAQSECASSVIRGGLKPRAILGAGSASECSVNDEAGSCADAWSSAMISELEESQKNPQEQRQNLQEQQRGGILVGDSKFQMMDDFAEMEQLTSTGSKQADEEERNQKRDLEEIVAQKEEQLSAANRLCMEISSKLVATEKEFDALQAKNSANEMSLIKLQEKLDLLLESQGGEKTEEDLEKLLKKKAEDEEIRKNSLKNSEEIQSALSANVQKVICLVESLAHAIGVEQHDQEGQSLPSPSSSSSISGSDDQHSTRFEKLSLTSNKLVQGQADFTDFMGELSAALNVVMAASVSSSDNGSEQQQVRRSSRMIEQGDLDSNKVADVQANQSERVRVLEAEVKNLSEELDRVRVEKDLLHERLRDAKNEIAAAERLVDDLKRQVSDLSEARGGLEERIRDAEATVADLREKVDSAEGKYQAEREQHEEIAARYRELQQQIDLRNQQENINAAGGIDHENGSHNGDEIAAKLAECQRTILALGKQLKTLSASDKPPPPDVLNCRYYDQERISDAEEMRNLESIQQHSSSGEFAWSKIKLQQDLEAETIPWSPPRSLESSAEENSKPLNRYGRSGTAAAMEDSDTNWLYSPEHSAGLRRSPMRSPGRYLSSKKPGRDAANELYKSVNLPLAASKNHSSFSRFFSRNR